MVFASIGTTGRRIVGRQNLPRCRATSLSSGRESRVNCPFFDLDALRRELDACMESKRYHDMDFVRAAAMLLGLVLHVCIFFGPPRIIFWGAGEPRGDVANLQIVSFIHLFRMQLFFLMAGFFAQLVIDRKGFGHLVRDRFKRILLPFLAGVLLLMPIHVILMNGINLNSPSSYYNDSWGELSFWQQVRSIFLFGAFDGEPGLKEGLIHFWFLYFLLIFYAAHFLLRPLFLRLGIKSIPGLGGFMKLVVGTRWGFLVLALLCFPFHFLLVSVMFWPSGFNAPLLHLAFYFLFYLFGAALYIHRDLLAAMARHSWLLIGVSLPFILLVSGPSDRLDGGAPMITDLTTWTIFDTATLEFRAPVLYWEGIVHSGWDKVLMVFIRVSLCWALCLGFIGLAHRYLDKPRPAVRYLADSAYWVYWVHLPVTFKLSMLGHQLPWGSSLLKGYLILLVSTVFIYWLYNAVVRYGWLGDFFMSRRKSRSDPGEEDFALNSLLRRSLPSFALVGVISLLLGALMHYERSDQHSEVLIEAYVTRDRAVLDACESIDGIRDHYGNTPLHTATRRAEGTRIYDSVPILIAKSSSLDARNDFGRTALFVAVRSGNRNDALTLLAAGADPNLADDHGHTPAHVAAIKAAGSPRHRSLLDDLKAHGANFDLEDAWGRTVAVCLDQFGGRDG